MTATLSMMRVMDPRILPAHPVRLFALSCHWSDSLAGLHIGQVLLNKNAQLIDHPWVSRADIASLIADFFSAPLHVLHNAEAAELC